MRISLILIFLFIGTIACRDAQTRQNAVVSAATPEATQAGIDILGQSGNAIDAAVAVAFALAVTEPAMTGLGAGIQIMVSIPGEDPFMINGTTYAPAKTPTTATRDDILYHRRSTIPTFVKTLDYVQQHYGSGHIEWSALIKPAIRYARSGFRIGPFRAKVFQRYRDVLLEAEYPMDYFLIDGNIPKEGDLLIQPVLAKTLQRLAEEGGNDFYNGEIANIIAADMKTHDGWITLEDLQQLPEPAVVPALTTTYRDHQIYTSTPPCGGWVVLLALNLMEQMAMKDLPKEERYHHLITALHLAHQERQAHPIQDMVNYQPATRIRTSKTKAEQLLLQSAQNIKAEKETDSGETTHFSIVDHDGMLVSVTTSINAYFGSRAPSPALGFLYNSYMEDFVYGDTTHAFAVSPGKMAYSSMSPTIVRDHEGHNIMAIGSPGSARIISAVAQIIQYWIDVDPNIQFAVAHPRVHASGTKAYLESDPSDHLLQWLDDHNYEIIAIRDDLSMNGHNAFFGGVHAVALENARWVGASDPRRDGQVAIRLNKSY